MEPVVDIKNTKDKDLRMMFLIRRFELTLLDLFSRGFISGTTHTCVGQEYIPVSIMEFIKKGDFIFSNHRGHGHYIARYHDIEGLLAEIMGKEGAVCNGVGGSQHIYRDTYLSTGIQGESLPIAVGVALDYKHKKKDALVLAFIGDGTWGQGPVYEALNMARLWELPLAVVVENNKIAQSTPIEKNMASNIENRVKGFDINYQKISTINIPEIRTIIRPHLDKVRKDSIPVVLEFETYRLQSHSKGDDTRSPEELDKIQAMDWYHFVKEQLPDKFTFFENEANETISGIVSKLKARSLSDWSYI